MKYIFGPVNSRRLGKSLGIDLFQQKTCNFNCIYCEVGPNVVFTCERAPYTSKEEIILEIDDYLSDSHKSEAIDVFTITASGEPTLHSGIREVIDHLKKQTSKPVALLTNGSLFSQQKVREDVHNVDILIPSLDSALPASFRKINRPVPELGVDRIIIGLEALRQNFHGLIWLEILLVKGINDNKKDIFALQNAIKRIKPDRIQLNTVARPPLESFARPLTKSELLDVKDAIDGPVEIIADYNKIAKGLRSLAMQDINNMLQRRPCTLDEIL